MIIRDSVIESNTSDYFGVTNIGIFGVTNAVVAGSRFIHDLHSLDVEQSNLTIVDCDVIESRGGWLAAFESSVEMRDCRVQSSGKGHLYYTSTLIDGCVFEDGVEIGLWMGGCDGVIANSLFTGQTIEPYRSVIDLLASPIEIVNCTFSGNHGDAMETGVIDAAYTSFGIANCVFRGNRTQPTNLFESDVSITHSNIEGGYPGTGNIDIDAQFVDAENGDYRLRRDSPCIDAGDRTVIPEWLTHDLLGRPRLIDTPWIPDTGVGPAPIPDMGAYEFQPISGDPPVRRDPVDIREVER